MSFSPLRSRCKLLRIHTRAPRQPSMQTFTKGIVLIMSCIRVSSCVVSNHNSLSHEYKCRYTWSPWPMEVFKIPMPGRMTTIYDYQSVRIRSSLCVLILFHLADDHEKALLFRADSMPSNVRSLYTQKHCGMLRLHHKAGSGSCSLYLWIHLPFQGMEHCALSKASSTQWSSMMNFKHSQSIQAFQPLSFEYACAL